MTDTDSYLDDAFTTLRERDRRHTLTYLHEASGTASLEELAEEINGETAASIENTKIELYHNHLPRLQEHGWVAYDPRSQQVRDTTMDADTKDSILLDYLADTQERDDDYMDEVFEVMANTANRETLYALVQEDGRSNFRRLSERIADEDKDTDTARHQLHHKALPSLQERDWVQYNSKTKKVTLTADPDSLPVTYLEQIYGDNE